MGNFKEDIARARALIFDVDGVMTDGGLIPLSDGDFIRKYNTKDGYALSRALQKGYRICVITYGRGATLCRYMAAAGIRDLYTECTDKPAALHDFLSRYGLDPQEVVYMGDDIPDVACMREVGIPVCPADAAVEVLEAARYVSQFGGGRGAVRDIVEQVLRARGDWSEE